MKKHACPSCGATLGIPDEHERMFTCEFCGTVLEDQAVNPSAPSAPEVPQITIVTNWSDPSSLPTYSAARTGTGCGVGILAVILAVVGGVGALVFSQMDMSFDDVVGEVTGRQPGLDGYNLRVAAVAGSDNETGNDVLTVVATEDGAVMHYLDLDAEDPTRWHDNMGIDQPGIFGGIVAAPELVYTSLENRLFAWNRRTGERTFTVELSDVVEHSYCVDCFQLIGDTLVTLAADGQLSAHAADSGTPRWSVRLIGTPRQIVNFGGQPAVIDGEPGQYAIRVFQVADGQQVATLTPDCGDGHGLGVYDVLLPLSDGGFFWQGSDIIETCAQRWVPGGAGPLWSTPLPDGGSAIDNERENFLVAGDRALVAADGTVASYSLETGERRETVRPDEELVVIAAGDGLAYLGAESTRGTRTWSVVAADIATGEVRWSFDTSDAPVDRFSSINVSSGGWHVEPIGGGLVVATFDDDADVVRMQVLNAADGTSTDPVSLDLGGYGLIAYPSFLGTEGANLIMGAGTTVLVVDPLTGEVIQTAP